MEDTIEVLIEQEQVKKRISEMAAQISEEYAGREVHLLCILKGSIFITCELARQLTVPCSIDFMSVSSYGNEMQSSGRVKIKKDLDEDIQGRHVIIVEDIIDSGRTLFALRRELLGRNPASLRICTLLDKPDKRAVDVDVDYTGFVIPDEFVVGYGLDYAQKHRNLPYIGKIVQ